MPQRLLDGLIVETSALGSSCEIAIGGPQRLLDGLIVETQLARPDRLSAPRLLDGFLLVVETSRPSAQRRPDGLIVGANLDDQSLLDGLIVETYPTGFA